MVFMQSISTFQSSNKKLSCCYDSRSYCMQQYDRPKNSLLRDFCFNAIHCDHIILTCECYDVYFWCQQTLSCRRPTFGGKSRQKLKAFHYRSSYFLYFLKGIVETQHLDVMYTVTAIEMFRVRILANSNNSKALRLPPCLSGIAAYGLSLLALHLTGCSAFDHCNHWILDAGCGYRLGQKTWGISEVWVKSPKECLNKKTLGARQYETWRDGRAERQWIDWAFCLRRQRDNGVTSYLLYSMWALWENAQR